MSLKCSVLKSGFCEQTQGFGGSNNHRGLDLVGKGYTLDDIVSYADGNVLMSVTGYGNGQGEGVNWRYGNFVKIQHDDGTVCLYAHMEYTSVRVGQRVSKGQVIGRMGNSGNSSGGHLHWEFWMKNDYYFNVDPTPYLAPKEPIVLPTPVERDKNKRQFQVDYNDNLRVRKTPNGEILGILNQGIYDFISTETNGGYEWVKLKDGMYSAITDMSRILEVEEIEESRPVEDGRDHSNVDGKEDITDEIEMLNKRIVELEDKLSLFEKQEQEYKYFVAPKEDIYYIRLKKNETLKYLRRD